MTGVPPQAWSGHSAEPEPCSTVSAVPASVPNAHLRLDELRKATAALIIAAEQDTVADWPSGVDGSVLDAAWAAIDATWPTIWTAEQVERLNQWQACNHVHPFTCPNRSDSWHRNEDGEELTLEAIPQGWVCRSCGYRQFWAHDFMFNGAPENAFTSAIEARSDATRTGAAEGESAAQPMRHSSTDGSAKAQGHD